MGIELLVLLEIGSIGIIFQGFQSYSMYATWIARCEPETDNLNFTCRHLFFLPAEYRYSFSHNYPIGGLRDSFQKKRFFPKKQNTNRFGGLELIWDLSPTGSGIGIWNFDVAPTLIACS
ncbi:hypothetical protein [Dehalogenimonas formicexedens]|nr:hypothetical protein [Dehalogenimonas formicexedens]